MIWRNISMRKEFLPFAKPMVSEEAIADVADSIRKGWLAMGPKTVDFEQKFADYVGCKFGISVTEFYSIHSLKSSRMHAVIDEFKKLMGGKVEVVQVNVDEEKTLAEFYTIVHIPTYIFLRKGEQLWRQTGELGLDRLEKAVKEFMV